MRALRTKAKGISGPSSSSSSNQSSPANAAVKSGPVTTPIKRTREPNTSSSSYSTPKKRGKKTNKGTIEAEDGDDESLLADTLPCSSNGQQQPLSPITREEPPQARISPRNLAKKNYKDLTDPFIKLNSDHQNLFEDTKSESEDSAWGSDGEFEVPKSAITLETEPLFY